VGMEVVEMVVLEEEVVLCRLSLVCCVCCMSCGVWRVAFQCNQTDLFCFP